MVARRKVPRSRGGEPTPAGSRGTMEPPLGPTALALGATSPPFRARLKKACALLTHASSCPIVCSAAAPVDL